MSSVPAAAKSRWTPDLTFFFLLFIYSVKKTVLKYLIDVITLLIE